MLARFPLAVGDPGPSGLLTPNDESGSRGIREQSKLLTVVLSSSELFFSFSASAVVSEYPPEGCVVGEPTGWMDGGRRADG